jgi:hypothetical protein
MVAGCASSHDVGESVLGGGLQLTAECQSEVADAFDLLPSHIECTGLYKDLATKTIAPGKRAFAPAYPLWSDASVKARWIYLPPDKKIDAKDPNSWKFPIGTRVWKEFRNSTGERRIETRVLFKKDEDDWARATYLWNTAETAAVRVSNGKELEVDGKPYHLPSNMECNACHAGRRDFLLGFEQVSLGLPFPSNSVVIDQDSMVTLQDLVDEGRLVNFKGSTHLQLGPNPDSAESMALGWIHTNCGVSCHNNNANSKAYSNGMRLFLDPAQLDGRPTTEFQPVTTTVGQDVFALQWNGKKRIVPGSPEESWLFTLITQRGDPKEQMPPLATNEVDPQDTEYVRQWIESLAPAE